MFHQFGFLPLRRFTQSPFLPSRTFHDVLWNLKRGSPTRSRISQASEASTRAAARSKFNAAQTVSFKGVVVAGCVGLGLAAFLKRAPVYCDVYRGHTDTSSKPVQTLNETPQSEVNYYELSFGTIAGVCSGIFVTKGAKLVATLLGGIFVCLQYFHSMSFIRIDWTKIGKGINNAIRIEDEDGTWHPPTILSVWSWLIDFLTADFQPRASFIAGFLLGLRLG